MSGTRENGSTLKEFRRLRVKGYLNAVAWNSNGTRLAGLSGFGHTVTVWETDHWTIVNEFDRYGGGYSNNSLAYMPDGTLLTSAPVGKSPDPKYKTLDIFSLLQWNPETGPLIRYIPDPIPNLGFTIGRTDTFAVSSDGSMVAGIMGGSRYGDVLLFETRTWSLVRRLVAPPTPQHYDTPWCLAFSPDGRELAIGTIAGRVHVFGVADGGVRLSFVAYADDGVSCTAIGFNPDGQTLVTGRGQVPIRAVDEGFTRLWRASDGKRIAILRGGGSATKIAWSASNLLAVGFAQSLFVWNASADPPSLALEDPGVTFCVAFSRDGTLAATYVNEVALYR